MKYVLCLLFVACCCPIVAAGNLPILDDNADILNGISLVPVQLIYLNQSVKVKPDCELKIKFISSEYSHDSRSTRHQQALGTELAELFNRSLEKHSPTDELVLLRAERLFRIDSVYIYYHFIYIEKQYTIPVEE